MPGWYDWVYSISEAALLVTSLFAVTCLMALAFLAVAVYRGSPRRAQASNMPATFVSAEPIVEAYDNQIKVLQRR